MQWNPAQQPFSTVGYVGVHVVGVGAVPRVTVHERVGDRVVGIVPRVGRDLIPVAVRVGALDLRRIHLVGDL